MQNRMRTFLRSEKGATAIEYSLLAALISLAILTALQTLGHDVLTKLFNKVTAAL